jgi:NAD(P)H-dependent FMN reductase
MALKLNVIVASTRPGRVGPLVAQWVSTAAKDHSTFEVELVDLADFKLPLIDEAAHPSLKQYQHNHTKRWSESVNSADAYVIVTPEYDFFPPASIVNAIQVVLKEWAYKPAGVVCYGGVSGGLRSAQQLRLLLGNVDVHALPRTVPVHFVKKHLSEDGKFTATEEMNQALKGLLVELDKWAVALKAMRPV